MEHPLDNLSYLATPHFQKLWFVGPYSSELSSNLLKLQWMGKLDITLSAIV